MVKFFAPWCIHCQNLEEIWDQFSTIISSTYNDMQSSTVIASIDCSENKKLCRAMEIKGLPTIKYIKADESVRVCLLLLFYF